MRRSIRVAVLILPMLLALALPASAAEAVGRIDGQVSLGTAGAPALGVVAVSLHTMVGGASETGTPVVASSDASGRFVFDKVDTDPHTAYVVTAEYQRVRYASELVSFAAGETTKSLSLTVYETSDKADRLLVRQQHVIVTPDGESGVLRVVEIAIVENGADRTFVGTTGNDASETLRLQLPADAYDVDFTGALSSNAAIVPGGIAYTGPLSPGQTQLVVAYVVNYPKAYDLRLVLPLATDAVDVLIDDVGVTAKSGTLAGPTSVDIGGKKFLRLAGRGLGAQSVVVIQISGSVGTGAAAASATSADSLAPFALAVLGLLTLYLLFGSRLRGGPRPPTRRRTPLDDDDDLEELPVA